MADPVYSQFLALATAAITQYGQAVTVTKKGYTYDPAVGTPVESSSVKNTYGVVFDVKDSMIDGEVIKRGDRLIYVSAEGFTFTPGPEDRVTVGAKTYGIQMVKITDPAGVAVLYELYVRTA